MEITDKISILRIKMEFKIEKTDKISILRWKIELKKKKGAKFPFWE